jgi:hypothetical protein
MRQQLLARCRASIELALIEVHIIPMRDCLSVDVARALQGPAVGVEAHLRPMVGGVRTLSDGDALAPPCDFVAMWLAIAAASCSIASPGWFISSLACTTGPFTRAAPLKRSLWTCLRPSAEKLRQLREALDSMRFRSVPGITPLFEYRYILRNYSQRSTIYRRRGAERPVSQSLQLFERKRCHP